MDLNDFKKVAKALPDGKLKKALFMAYKQDAEIMFSEGSPFGFGDPLHIKPSIWIKIKDKAERFMLSGMEISEDEANNVADKINIFLKECGCFPTPPKNSIFVATPEFAHLYVNIQNELKERGDFEIDVVRLVDILLELHIVKAKEYEDDKTKQTEQTEQSKFPF